MAAAPPRSVESFRSVHSSHYAHGKHSGVHARHDRACGDGGSDRVHGQRIRVLPHHSERRIRVGLWEFHKSRHFRNLKCDLKCGKCSEKPTHNGSNSIELLLWIAYMEEFESKSSLLDSFMKSTSSTSPSLNESQTNVETKQTSLLDTIDQMEDDAFFEETSYALPSNVRMEEEGLKVDTTDGRNVETE